MTATFSGPMFQAAENDLTKSIYDKTGGHYNIHVLKRDDYGITLLKNYFPNGEANELNFVLFSTSGVHGTYFTIEEIEASFAKYGESRPYSWDVDENVDAPGDFYPPELTFLIIHPRIVGMVYGNLTVRSEDIPFLKKLRETSRAAVGKIGG